MNNFVILLFLLFMLKKRQRQLSKKNNVLLEHSGFQPFIVCKFGENRLSMPCNVVKTPMEIYLGTICNTSNNDVIGLGGCQNSSWKRHQIRSL